MSNPYSIFFGMEPKEIIPRPVQKNQILSNFQEEDPSARVCMITGARGSGKAVLLTELAVSLFSQTSLAEIFRAAKINHSFFGMGLEVKGEASITDIETALQRMLASLSKKGKKVLVEIDEVTNRQSIRELAVAFQIFIRKNYLFI